MSTADIGVFGGSGFYSFLDDVTEETIDTPYGEPTAAVRIGTIGDRRVAFLPRHGASHEFPPHKVNYRANLKAIWANAGFAGRREVGLLVRMKDPKNTLAVRVRSMGTASPELRLFKILNGTETQLGPTISGISGLSATAMNAELEWGVRVEDLQDDTAHSKVQLYLGASSPTVKGTAVGDPWMPNLCSKRSTRMGFSLPSGSFMGQR